MMLLSSIAELLIPLPKKPVAVVAKFPPRFNYVINYLVNHYYITVYLIWYHI